MKQIGNLLKAAVIAFALGVSANVATAAEDPPMVDGIIKDVRADGRLTIKHGPIPNLDMGAMTMVFNLSDPKFAKGVKVGDKVKIEIKDVAGKLTVTNMKKGN